MGKRKRQKSINNANAEIDKSRTKFKSRQSANASVNQGGNAFAINANELGIIRIRPGSH
ncbi:hypothetical protein ACFQ88_29330 [Paenibacillus sp. NPDC056579]|uniref:hypothetical protein n=1 Tax=unclassified Paenibacillus TaxID=185978 RepID=UPI001EF9A89F|nr:hypothetical protein [Paenibacillus sp. H1-7]